ncbi:MAG TPA: hypothetical protein VN950_11220 [Terriglobales bacterium]|nr:hypothetical protein [Terriglobales bacterium]
MMTNLAQARNEQIESYLTGLDGALRGVGREERDEILREIRTHILDSLPDNPEAGVETVLRALGAPERLAEQYQTEFLLTQASRSFSPWLLLSTAWRWAHTGIRGFAVFMVAMVGYTMALGFLVTVLLKPFLPNRIGLWVGHGNFVFGATSQGSGVHDVLGSLYIPVTMLLAFGTAVGTTHALRWLMRTRRRPAR